MEIDKSFDPAPIEARWYPLWESRGYFKAGLAPGAPAFCIQLPPPNVTGILHIATQIVVERQIEATGASREQLGRERFVEQVWQWKERSGSTIALQMRRLGASADWSREYFTMDAKLSRVVTETFVRLYEQGLIYRG